MARFRIRDKQGREYGPVDASELRSWIMDARLTADMLIQQEGLKDWYRAGDVPAIARLLAERAATIARGRATGASGGGSGKPPPPPDSGTAAGVDSFPPDDGAYSYSPAEDAEAAPPSPPTPTPQHNPPTFHPPTLWGLLPDRVIARLVAALCVNLVISVGLSALFFLFSEPIYEITLKRYIYKPFDYPAFRLLCTGAGLIVANIVFLAVFIGPPAIRRGLTGVR